jgi:hypothetical protein
LTTSAAVRVNDGGLAIRRDENPPSSAPSGPPNQRHF